MYSPLNEYLVLQEMHDRVARMNAARGTDTRFTASRPNRRWWRKVARLAG